MIMPGVVVTSVVVAGVWVGFDAEKTMGRSGVGGRAAAPLRRACPA